MSTSNELAAAFQSLTACNAKELRELSMKAKDLASTRNLSTKQSQTQDLMYETIKVIEDKCAALVGSKEAELKAAAVKVQEVAQRRHDLEADVDRMREQVRVLQADVDKRRIALAQQPSSAPSPSAQAVSTKSKRERTSELYLRRAQLASEIQYHTWLLRNLADLSDGELRGINLQDASPVLEDWERTVERTERSIEEMSRESAALGSSESWVADVRAQWGAVKRARAVQDARLTSECVRRQEKDQNVQNFLMEQAKMLQWCREQTVQLENLQQPDHIQEFCASLQNNNTTMEANFLVLGEMAEGLLPNTAVQKALTDVSREWFQLQVYTYERLRQCLLDQHANSKIEDTLRAWSNYFYPVKEFFHTVEGLLLQPTEEEAVAFLNPLLESVRTLQNEAVPHQLIVDHLADFSLRMQCIQENYTAMRPSIFSTLSLMYPALAVNTSVQHAAWSRRSEYNQKVADLADWIDVNGQAQIWENLRKRVDRVRQTMDEEVS